MDNRTAEARSVSRRGLVKGAAGVAAVAAGAAASAQIPATTGHGAAPAPLDAAAAATTARSAGALPKEDWAIYVRDADSGELDVFVGTEHYSVHDSDLVARLIASVK